MSARLLLLGMLAVLLAASPAKKTVGTARGENEDLIVDATIYVDPSDVKDLLGNDLGGHFIVAEVKVQPKYGKQIMVDRDDFVLWTDKDGEHSTPFVGSQIAGNQSLVVTRSKSDENSHHPGIMIGGIGGGGGTGGSVDNGNASSKVQAAETKDNSLVKTLNEKILVEGKTKQPVSGLLYFPLEKQKMKDLELKYGGRENRINLKFK